MCNFVACREQFVEHIPRIWGCDFFEILCTIFEFINSEDNFVCLKNIHIADGGSTSILPYLETTDKKTDKDLQFSKPASDQNTPR